MICYNNSGAAITLAGITYLQGYHISAQFTLFSISFTLDAAIPNDRSGVVINGVYNGTIDLGFLKIGPYTLPNGSPSAGPGLTNDTTQTDVSKELFEPCRTQETNVDRLNIKYKQV